MRKHEFARPGCGVCVRIRDVIVTPDIAPEHRFEIAVEPAPQSREPTLLGRSANPKSSRRSSAIMVRASRGS